MPNVLSKLFAGHFGLQLCHAECMELSHTWNPSCLLAIRDALGPSWIFCLKTYGSLYFLKALVDKRGRVDRLKWRQLAKKTLRSSLFLTSTEILFMLWLCALRRLLGFAIWPTISFVNGFLACIISIWIESKQRRAMLIPYLLNLATEAAFRRAKQRNAVRSLPFGESLIFGLSSGLIAITVLMRNHQSKHSRNKFANSSNFLFSVLQQSHGIPPEVNEFDEMDEESRVQNRSNVQKIITLASRNFLISFGALLSNQIFKRFFTRQKSSIWPSLRLPMFVASMPLLNELFNNLLNFSKLAYIKILWRQSLSIGLSSTLSMALFWPNNSLALYIFWKMIELIYYRLVLAKIIPVIPGGDAILFSLVSSYLLSLAVLEPQALRSSYYKFLCSLTGDRLQLFNRPLFDKYFATNSCAFQQNTDANHPQPISLLPPNLFTINPAFYCKSFPAKYK